MELDILHPDAEATAQADIDAHLADPTDAHDASAISFVPTGTVAATDVQAAIAEVAAEASAGVSDHGALTGLGDDDHTQYHTDARGDARYWPLSTDLATQAELDAHVGDTIDAHDASAISFTPTGTIAATDVQAAIAEVASEAGGGGGTPLTVKEDGVDVDTTVTVIDFLGADFDVGAEPTEEVNVSISSAIARQAALDAHINDAADAHDASAISVLDTAAQFTGTDVEAVLAEVQDNLDAHLADAVDAHDASAISYAGGTGISATDVEAAIDELATEKLNSADYQRVVQIKVIADSAVLTTGNGQASFVISDDLNGLNLIDADAAVVGTSSSGTPTVQIRRVRTAAADADMLSTAITIDVGEVDSYSAATPPVIDGSNDDVQTGDRIYVDVDVAGTGTDGLDVILSFGA